MIQLTPLGGANEIGGSCTLVEAAGALIVVDYGVRPKAAADKYPDLERIAERGTPDALVITHAHADHIGGLPLFHRRFPTVPIYATLPSMRILRTMLADSVNIMERDFEGEIDYTQDEVDALNRVLVPIEFGAPVVLPSPPGVRVTMGMARAGHILGAGMLGLEVETNRGFDRVFLSGDVSGFTQPTIPGADLDAVRDFRPSLMVLEGTYGDHEHPDFAVEEARFVQRVASVLAEGGKVLIPAFAVGRAQNVALILRDAINHPERIRRVLQDPGFTLPKSRVWLDGMCRTIADIYDSFQEHLNPTLRRKSQGKGHVFYDPDGILRPVSNPKERRDLQALPGPMVMIASSGMMTGGPSLAFARAIAGDPKNAILLCGYQDEESPGYMLRKLTSALDAGGEAPTVSLGGEETVIRCQVDQYNMSGHSDARGLEDLFAAVRPRKLVLVHGTPSRLAALQRRLEAFAKREGLDAVVEIAHRDETIASEGVDAEVMRAAAEVARTEDGCELPLGQIGAGAGLAGAGVALTHAHATPDAWMKRILTGRGVVGPARLSPATPYIAARLQVGGHRPLTDVEVARLDTGVPSVGLPAPEDLVFAREALKAGEGYLWQAVETNPQRAERLERERQRELARRTGEGRGRDGRDGRGRDGRGDRAGRNGQRQDRNGPGGGQNGQERRDPADPRTLHPTRDGRALVPARDGRGEINPAPLVPTPESPTVLYTPRKGDPSRSLAQIIKKANFIQHNAVARSARGQQNLDAHWARVREMGIGLGDLVLFLQGSVGSFRLLPGVTVAEAPFGFELMAPGAIDPRVAVNQIVARVGPWVSPTAGVGPRSVVELQLLEAIGRAVSAFVVESVEAENARGQSVAQRGKSRGDLGARSLAAVWSLVPAGRLTPQGGMLGSLLLVNWRPGTAIQVTIDDLVALVGGAEIASPMMVVTWLRELQENGLIQMTDQPDHVEIRWTARALSGFGVRPEAETLFAVLGPAFERQLRSGFFRALAEVQRLGLNTEKSAARMLWLSAATLAGLPTAAPIGGAGQEEAEAGEGDGAMVGGGSDEPAPMALLGAGEQRRTGT